MSDTSIDYALSGQAGAATAVSGGSEADLRDFVDLLKPRVMSLVVFSGFAGLFIAPGDLHPFLAAVAVLCIAVAAGASGAINMWYDRDIDAVMSRTAHRPIPAGRIDGAEALAFGVALSLFSVLVMALAVNYVAAALLGLAIAFYVFVYTIWLKRRTPQNIVIGGAAGAFPPVIGWAAVTGGVSIESLVLFALIFVWTPPHFWALALYRCEEYQDAKVPMLPVVAGHRHTKWQMLAYTVLLWPIAVAPAFLGMAGVVYGVCAAVLGTLFVLFAVKVLREKDPTATRYRAAKQMFAFSVLYLVLLFALLIVDRAPGLLS